MYKSSQPFVVTPYELQCVVCAIECISQRPAFIIYYDRHPYFSCRIPCCYNCASFILLHTSDMSPLFAYIFISLFLLRTNPNRFKRQEHKMNRAIYRDINNTGSSYCTLHTIPFMFSHLSLCQRSMPVCAGAPCCVGLK